MPWQKDCNNNFSSPNLVYFLPTEGKYVPEVVTLPMFQNKQ